MAGGDLDQVRLLAEAARAVHASVGLDDKLEWVVNATCELSGAAFGAYMTAVDGGTRLAAVTGGLSDDLGALDELFEEVIGPDARDVETLRIDDISQSPRWRDRRLWAASKLRSWLVVPVYSDDGWAHGAIVFGRDEAGGSDGPVEAAVTALATHLGVALDNLATVTRLAELEAVQREVVHQLQEAVRPPTPVCRSTELGVHYLPADSSAPTGGDLYDWLVLPDGGLHLAVVDVMGKGVAATKEALSITFALRLLVLEGCPMEALVARADSLVSAQSPDVVATFVVARYRPEDGTVEMVAAGHPPALVVSPDRTTRYVAAPGVPIGWPGAGSSEVVRVTLERSEALVLYTDGLIEATKDILAGLDGLAEAASETARYPAAPMARALVDRALAGAMRRDDSLALVLRRRTPPPPTPAHPLGPFEYRFSPNNASVSLARHFLRDWLDHLSVDRDDIADLLLVATELCANAVRHATGSPGALVLRAWPDSHDLLLEVEDDGTSFDWPDRYEDEMPDPEAEHGRGLFLVETLSDDLVIQRDDDRTVVQIRKCAILSTRG